MPNYNSREQLRRVYQQTDEGDKTFIPAKPKVDLYGEGHLFRVCAYCRVSTDNDEQLSSFELQQAHYKQVVQDHPNWELKRIYADEGISGTSLKNRDSFNEMIAACQRGEYDLIVTKSVSRFARNLVDCISLIRMLKSQTPPVGVFFETDNLYVSAWEYTLDTVWGRNADLSTIRNSEQFIVAAVDEADPSLSLLHILLQRIQNSCFRS